MSTSSEWTRRLRSIAALSAACNDAEMRRSRARSNRDTDRPPPRSLRPGSGPIHKGTHRRCQCGGPIGRVSRAGWYLLNRAAWPETAAAAMTGEIGEGVALTPDATVRALRDEQRLPATQNLTRSVDGYGSRARDADQQYVDLGIDVLGHAIARGEHDDVDVEILALM